MRRYYSFCLVTYAIIVLSGCSIKETISDSELPVDCNIVFTATREATVTDTKTLRLDDGYVWWSPSEEVSVFYGSGDAGGSKFVTLNNTLAEIVELSGSVQMSGSGKYFWAVYPYSTDNTCDGNSVTMTVPARQDGVDGNFSNDEFPTVAKSKTLELAFWNVCGGVKFFVSRSDIKSVSFKGNNGEILAGKVNVAFNADGVPEVTEVIDGKTEVILTAPDGGCFKVGKYYYITLLPAALNSGFTLSLRADTAKGQVVSNNPQTIKRSVFGVLKNIDSKVQDWEEALPLPNAVDLGLSVLWASFNVGASAPEEYGNYYAFGETAPKDEYTSDNYIYPHTKEYSGSSIATKVVVFNEEVLTLECDAAQVAYGGEWRMPTRAECEELVEGCTPSWICVNGTEGYLFTSKINGNSIFLPDAGFKKNDDDYTWNQYGPGYGIYYWSSSTKGGPYLLSQEDGIVVSNIHGYSSRKGYSYFGQSVRAVRTNPRPRHVESLSIDKTEITLYEGRYDDLKFSVFPVTAANRKVVCTSSAPDVASVSWRNEYNDRDEYKSALAVVEALKAGTAIITVATVDGGFQANCKVTVLPKQEIEAVDLGLSVKWASMNLDAYGPEEYGRRFEWLCGDNKQKYVSDNYHECKPQLDLEDDRVHVSLGDNWRMPTIEEWKELAEHCTWSWASFHEVSGYTVTSQINGNSIFLPAEGYYMLSFPVAELNGLGSEGYYWSSSTIPHSNGWARCFRFHSNGIYFNSEFFYSYPVDLLELSVRPVYADRVHPAVVSLNKSALSLMVGGSRQLKAMVSPIGAIDKTVSWSSDRTDIATVDSEGIITAVSTGSAIITVTTNDGNLTATCSVTVIDYFEPEAVDLGLSSGLKWASCNLGATKPEEYGDYFAWGETEPKTDYSWATYKFEVGTDEQGPFSKYSGRSSNGGDDKVRLDIADDTARLILGGSWRMPTKGECNELRNNCTWTWTTQNGVNGRLVTGPNGNSIFLPAAGLRNDTVYSNVGSWGRYWSTGLFDFGVAWIADGIFFDSGDVGVGGSDRFYGFSVRPVTK